MRLLLTGKYRLPPRLTTLGLTVFIGCGSGVLLAASTIGLPYTLVPSAVSEKLRDVDSVESAWIEVAPDAFSSGYRSGIDVYKSMAEHSFDDEPMVVVYAKADPAMALPEVVVTSASIDSEYTHITAAEAIPSAASEQHRDVDSVEHAWVEVAPDAFSSRYRSGIDVYKNMAEHSFDDEPMVVTYAKADPAMALPEVVVISASIDSEYTHITAAEAIIDPLARGEDKIYLQITAPSAALSDAPGAAAPGKPKQRRFFTES